MPRPDGATTLNLHQITNLPLTVTQLAEATSKEPLLSRVLRYTAKAWPVETVPELKGYQQHKTEFSIEAGCPLRVMRVVVPERYRAQILAELHTSHPGMVRMKGIDRARVWWPGIDQDIEKIINNSEACQGLRNPPPPSPMHPRPWPTQPWEKIHVDFASPFMGSMFLVVVDAYSKWLEVIPMATTSAGKTLEALRTLFARYRLP